MNAQTKESQTVMSIDQAVNILKEGNNRFIANQIINDEMNNGNWVFNLDERIDEIAEDELKIMKSDKY